MSSPDGIRFDLAAAACLPQVLEQLLDASVREEETFAHAAQLALLDPALYAQLLDAACAQGLTANRRFAVVSKLLAGMGWNTIRAVASSAALAISFGAVSAPALHRLWRKAMRSAHLCQHIALRVRYPNPQEAYVAGLLCDLGRLVILGGHPGEYGKLLEQDQSVSELMDRERSRFGATHIEVAEQLVAHWRFDSFIGDAVRYQHHAPDTAVSAHPLVRIVNLSAGLVDHVGDPSERHIEHARAFFGIEAHDLAVIVADADEASRQVAADLRLDPSETSAYPASKALGENATPLMQSLRSVHLLNAAQNALALAPDQRGVYATLRDSFRMLIGSGDAVAFMVDQEARLLKGLVGEGQSPRIDELSLPLVGARSLLADCLEANLPRHSFEEASSERRSVFDEQITRLLGADGVLCLPLKDGDRAFGTIVLSVSKAEFGRVEAQQAVLMAFARHAARALSGFARSGATSVATSGAAGVPSPAYLRRIVHEVNNPLGIMKNYIKILTAKLDRDDSTHFGLDVIDEEIDRIAKILRGLAERGETRSPILTPVNVNQLIFDLVRITDEPFWVRDSIRLRTDLDHAVKPIPCDRDKLKQVLVNLIKNAAEAMPEGGEITVATRAQLKQARIDQIEIVVADNGPGLPAEVLARLFEPVPTAKGSEHFGLGLSIVKNLVAELEGTIRCKSDGKNGTRFSILLPART